ncbi:MAG TPA: aspartate carbamoyltransferase [Patescibacteria group bacterium]
MHKEIFPVISEDKTKEADGASFFEENVKPIREFKNAHIIQAEQFNPANLEVLFHEAGNMESLGRKKIDLLSDFTLATLFYEASTRTRLSFETAMHNLKGDVITESNVQFSSRIKGETLEDTIRIVSNYAEVIALRHERIGAAKIAAEFAGVPIINAGDGAGQHPTQAFLDVYTINKEINRLEDFTISFIGDLRYGRTVHSLTYLLSLYPNVKMHFVAPKILGLPKGIKEYLKAAKISFSQNDRLDDQTYRSDVVYVTRVQKERFTDPNDNEYEQIKAAYWLPANFPLKSEARILHPFPRNEEIPQEIDKYSQAAYFRQSANGVPIRMALLKLVLLGN